MGISPQQLEDLGRPIAGRYVVEEVLGRGGMGAVYRVRDLRDGTSLALKRGAARTDSKMLKRQVLLQREYHTLAQLAHPRIIEVYDYGVDERGPYYTMELLDGADLDQSGRLPWKQACALLRDVASSLAILHSRGLVHRDVSARNVRCTADGRAKLIDFGAMASMGVAKEAVGTPPFMAPEVLQMQALDARADLFSLGALGYYLITGRHAYPARRIGELPNAWRSAPAPPIRLIAELPAALNALLMQLLSLDRGGRPQSAAEVMKRLCAIAGLPTEEHGEVSRAYLATPALIGRDKALVAVRKRMLSLGRGDGGTLLVEGVSGSGRSRLLDACVLEGKLLGATVVRADASDGVSGDWGVARAIGAQLVELKPERAAEASRLSRDVIGHVVEGLDSEASATLPERSLLIRELRDFVLSMARGQRILLAIDDADRIDEPSSAFIAALAHKTDRHPLILVLAMDRESKHTSSASLRLLNAVADRVELDHLLPEQTEALMRSVFGDVANLSLCAARIHALSQGNPRAIMELAQHLVDRGLARYEAGSWSLPEQLDEGDLPPTLAASLGTRLSALGADARELAEALCLADGSALALASYPELTSHGDPARVFGALDELVAARVLAADGERYRFSQRGFLAVLQDAIGEPRRAAIHSRIAELLARVGGDVVPRAQHLLASGRDREAIELLCSIDLLARLPPLGLLEQAVSAAERLALPARTIQRLRMAVLSKATLIRAMDSFRRCVWPVLQQLERDSGLLLYRALGHLPESERLTQALTQTQQRYLATPEHERVHPVPDAVRELARMLGAFTSLGTSVLDLPLLESLPDLTPLMPLSPALGVASLILETGLEWVAGRQARSRILYAQILARIAEPDRAGLDDAQYARTYLGIHFSLGLVTASQGMSIAEHHAQVLEGDRELRVNAWRVRQLLHLSRGDAEEARKCLRRAELLQLQEGLEPRYAGTSAGFEMAAHSMADDLLGVKSAVEAVSMLAAQHPGWRPVLLHGLSRSRQLEGDLEGALDVLLPAFELAKPTRHPYFPHLAAAHVGLLSELGRNAEAIERGRAYLEQCEREELAMRDHPLYVWLALALARNGAQAEAIAMIEPAIELARKHDRAGLPLGWLYEARARIALAGSDRVGFAHFAERCAEEYRKGNNPALSAKYARLVEEARQLALGPVEAAPRGDELIGASQTDAEYVSIHSRMLECVDESDRARCALTMLLQSLESFAGYLYGVDGGELRLLAGLPENAPEAELDAWLRAQAQSELGSQLEATATEDDEERAEPEPGPSSEIPLRYTDAEGRRFEPLWLIGLRNGQRQMAAVLVFHVVPGPRTVPDRMLLAQIADHLLEHGVQLED